MRSDHMPPTSYNEICLLAEEAVIPLLTALILGALLSIKLHHIVVDVLDELIRQPSAHRSIPKLDPLQLGLLGRGRQGVIETALAKLVQRGVLVANEGNNILVISEKQLPADLSKLERQVIADVHKGQNLRQLYGNPLTCEDAKGALMDLQLLPNRQSRVICLLVALALPLGFFGFGWSTLLPQLAILLIVTSCLLVHLGWGGIVVLSRLERTRWGDYVLKHYRDQHDIHDAIVCIALYGPGQMLRSKNYEALGRVCDQYYRDHVWDG